MVIGPPIVPWGKTNRAEGVEFRWHPLRDHLADVAAVAWSFLRGSAVTRRRLARLAGLDDFTEVQVARLCVFVALHDIGKVGRGFQRRWSRRVEGRRTGHVREPLAALRDPRDGPRLRHALRWQTLDTWATNAWALLWTSITHHGEPVQDPGMHRREFWRPSRDAADPERFLADTMTAIERWFPQAFASGEVSIPVTSEFTHAFAGLVMFADWFGSDTGFFAFSETLDEDPCGRWKKAVAAAESALRAVGLDASHLRVPPGDLLPLLLDGREPHASQVAVARAPLDATTILLEEETGRGKTEAVLAAFLRLFREGVVEGLYFALPTRAAAKQMHERVLRAVRRVWENEAPPVVLAVPGYRRVNDCVLPSSGVRWDDEWRDGRVPRGWAAEEAKRYCAATIAVGTVDQALLSAVRTKHAPLRACLLLRTLLVVDEVHALDEYMRVILDRVLRLRRQAGAPTFLLSATLEAARRELFLGANPAKLEDAVAVPYPRLTWEKSTDVQSFDPAPSSRIRRVQVRVGPWIEEPEFVARKVLEAARRGARVLVVRNSVAGCRRLQRALEEEARARGEEHLLFCCNGTQTPHHGLFAAADREILDRVLARTFGRRRGPHGVVAITTQTAEQSLDIDADLLVTDLCPADVLAQRLGRLHRFPELRRPRGFAEARCIVLTPTSPRDLYASMGESGQAFGRHGLGTVYEDLTALDATWRQLLARPVIEFPRDARSFVERSLHVESRANLQASNAALRRNARHKESEDRVDRQTGDLAAVNFATPYPASAFSRRRLPTRLGGDDRLVRLDPAPRSPFGRRVTRLRVPGRWLTARGIPADVDVLETRETDGGFAVIVGDSPPLHYDAHGLHETHVSDTSKRKEPDDDEF